MKIETKVGLLFTGAVVMIIIFAWLMGVLNPFSNAYTVYVQYNFAGGIEVGSPVRVMGIKVGKVERIDFAPFQKDVQGNEVKLKLTVSIDKKAREAIRYDSKFFINLAGIIGEKFLEVSPGSIESPVLSANAVVRGEDPPRIDQLISQSYGLAGKILELVSKNEGSVTHTLQLFDNLVTNLNRTLTQLDKTTKNVEVTKLLKNMVEISDDVHFMTSKIRTADGEKTLQLLHQLLWRLEPMTKENIREFLQKEGIKAKIF
ncbi:MAG: MlaD family protein [Oligoflexia bacterium]|nr:MlaD family protein [Oligoflexia bacterium]